MARGHRTRTLLTRIILVAGLALAGLVGVLTTAGPANATARLWNGATRAHPYSNPIWWPLAASGTVFGCYHGNGARCQNPIDHSVYAMDVVAPSNSRVPVYAMGAGVVHIGSTGWHCSTNQSRGNWITVDHGNGTTTEYGHLGTIYVHEGDLVTPRTRLATVGQSGYSRCASKPYYRYLWLAVRKNGGYFHFRSSYTCIGTRRVQWPQQLPSHATDDWNKVPGSTALPTSQHGCVSDTPRTATRAGGVRLTRATVSSLRASWAAVRSADHVTSISVQLQEYHSSVHRWSDYATHVKTPGSRATTFTGLPRHHEFRARVWLGNASGWSAPSAWDGASTA